MRGMPGWNHPLRAIVRRLDNENELECGHTASRKWTTSQRGSSGNGDRQRCTRCPMEQSKEDHESRRRKRIRAEA